MTNKKTTKPKTKTTLSQKQKTAIGIGLLGVLLIAILVGVVFVFQNKTDEFSVNTGVDASTLTGDAQTLTVGEDGVEITSGGIYELKTNIESGCVIVRADNADVELILNNVSITNSDGPAIYVESADNFYLQLVGSNTLVATTSSDYNGAIYSKDDILIYGDGSLDITSNIDGIVGKDDLQIDGGKFTISAEDDGIVGKDSVKVTGGVFDITAGGDGFKTSNETEKGDAEFTGGTFTINTGSDGLQIIANLLISGGTFDITAGNGSGTTSTSSQWLGSNTSDSSSTKGIKADSSVQIDSGTITVNSQDDAFHSNGNVTINGGVINLASGDDGMHADNDLTVNGGTINITKAYEGIEGGTITINDGDIKVVASDDGFNAAGGSDTTSGRVGGQNNFAGDTSKVLTINGGTIYVNASGDGLDSNGNLYIAGGTTYVDGPTNNGNGPIDYGDSGCEFKITGGTLIAVGSSGMAVNATSATQTTVMINLTSSYTGAFTFGDISYSPAKSYQSVLISSDKLSLGSTYTLKINNTDVQSVTLNNVITTSGTAGMQPGMGQGRQGGMQGSGRR